MPKDIEHHFDDIADLMSLRPVSPENKDRAAHLTILGLENEGASWFGVSGGAKAVEKLMRNGWPEGVKRIYDALGKIGADIQAVSIKRRLSRGDQGDEYDVHAAMSGGLDRAWTRRTRQARVAGGAVVTIGVDVNQTSNESSEQMFWRGAAAVRLADILTEAGYLVAITAFARTKNAYKDGTARVYSVKAKAANQPLDLSAVASSIALAGSYRRFSLWQALSANKECSPDMGNPDSTHRLEGADFCVMRGDVYDRSTAEAWLCAVVSTLNERTRLAA